MEARESWHTLQAHLTDARARLDAGDRAAALAAIDAALAIDPNFLAARSLRERVMSAPFAQEAVPAPDHAAPIGDPGTPPAPPPALTDLKAGYAQFEQRTRRRRVDRRLDAARSAITRGQVKEAAAALEEVIELDPNAPDIPELRAQLDALRHRPSSSRGGRWLAAAAAFGAIVLGATWLQDAVGLNSRPMFGVSPLPTAPDPSGATVFAAEPSVGGADARSSLDSARVKAFDSAQSRPLATAGTSAPAPERSAPLEPPVVDTVAASQLPKSVTTIAPPPAPIRMPEATLTSTREPIAPPTTAPAIPPSASNAPAFSPAASAAAEVAPAALVKSPDDESMVKQTLQHYRVAYEDLDARSARAIWPAVDESKLARAFQGLQSQKLTFDACDVRLLGQSAEATCRGSARYVPKVGSREPRVEPRTWNFTLKKDGTDWKIQSARADRD